MLQLLVEKVLVLGNTLPTNDPATDQSRVFPLADGDEILKGDVFNFNNSYFMSITDIGAIDETNPLHDKYLSLEFNPESSSDFVKVNAKIDSSIGHSILRIN